MPFKSKEQMRKCFAMKARGEGKGWDCEEWADATPNPKKLPEKVTKTASYYCDLYLSSFVKVAKSLFDPKKAPAVSRDKVEAKATKQMVQDTVARRMNNVMKKRPASIRRAFT